MPSKELTTQDLREAAILAASVAGDQGIRRVLSEVFLPLGLVGVKSCPSERYPELYRDLQMFIAERRAEREVTASSWVTRNNAQQIS